MSVATVLAVLKADSMVTNLVGSGSDARISPMTMSQGIDMPAVTLQRVSVTPQNNLRNNGSLDDVRIQLDAWATSYAGVLALASACRSAMENAGHILIVEVDNYDPEVDPKLFRVTQDYQVWE